ncbi:MULTISPECIES: c-type cytochrome biogenesis protein CcmI [Pseudoalteromonas]|jgi:cytochrome c-type biogenesis protein CcmI|uniref:c-type cytochrome biogenesis protein CcmI n=1 Tax=Pseudoalteromonas TaxID=53246 RepID=UPI0004046FA1|nr:MULTISPECIES: c-type cytochrome biogenesis protein CcmI [Pseudoalteromonas]KAA1162295.1 c-type cytochrome biogenesis protein CcmI [Pseudoalteromonas distincta]MBB1295848.1 c-type cytochrome biogenesis protein CcmI [Pseudoalteromonas sp. SR41-7]MBB1305482.1 c-type cytochrome biogenesis protein CcmI [Pseudoalteromonas sp. SR43-5]MBB1327073.1 c-type cytochrome biogenesis protein CcmI [Pseudoalteromonas sp. SR45-1]MBB1330302.1 c-type cytochrome biogenesis protein CcmI [Pseudoalteromonas sp. SR4|tara:strand:+ start:68957 stop:70210 length:1254 start_codon:yes stop_codon:yes gene_type:complete
MILMWACFALLTLVALSFVMIPFLKKERVQTITHNANAELISIYEQRLVDLQTDLDNQRIDSVNHAESIVELKRRLLNELSPEKSLNSKGNNRIFALTGGAFVLALTGIFYSFTGSQQQISAWHDAMDNLADYGERAVMQKGEPLSQNELQAFALALRTKLSRSGDDEVAWMLLGRVAMSLNEFDMAQQSFDKALRMNPDNMQVLISYSQVLLLEGSEANMTRAAGMLSKVLNVEPTNLDAISLLALIAYERKDWPQAKTAFEVLLASMEKNDSRYNMISERIADIEQQMQSEGSVMPVTTTTGAIAVTVDIAKELIDKQPKDGILFIFAKAATGSPMPLAAVKLTKYSFPITVELSDSSAMVAGLNLSSAENIIISARISIDDSVMPSSGELEGHSQALKRESVSDYQLQIDTLIP